ncbi:SMI1/KNR4 family protein, partial [Bacillus cereus]
MGEITWLFTDKSVDEKTISKVEQSFGIKFPQDYKECVIKYNGGYPKPDNFDFSDEGEGEGGAVFNNLLSFTGDFSIEAIYEFSKESLQKGIIPFARDPFGNLICFDYRQSNNEPTVVFFDHEEQGENSIELICNTFTELLNKLYS